VADVAACPLQHLSAIVIKRHYYYYYYYYSALCLILHAVARGRPVPIQKCQFFGPLSMTPEVFLPKSIPENLEAIYAAPVYEL